MTGNCDQNFHMEHFDIHTSENVDVKEKKYTLYLEGDSHPVMIKHRTSACIPFYYCNSRLSHNALSTQDRGMLATFIDSKSFICG